MWESGPFNAPGVVAPAVAGSGWGDHDLGNNTLSTTTISNDTVTAGGSDWGSARGTQGRSTGKYYFEVEILTRPDDDFRFMIGLLDGTTAGGSFNRYIGNFPNGVANSAGTGQSFFSGSGFGGFDLSGLLTSGVVKLKTASFSYTPPSGYSAWG